jgi:serine protease AprX
MGFTNNAVMFDSGLGPNGTFGYGSNVKGAFGDFTAEVTPEHTITMVEVVLHGYVSAKLGADPKITPYVGGQAGATFVLDRHVFDSRVGAANVGTIYLDITTSRAWSWADFDNNLQLMIDQSKLSSKQKVYHDAIGLRVTSAPGAGASGDSGGDASAVATVNTSTLLNVYNQVIRSSELWNTGNKLQGKGVTVAVIDSGVVKTKDLNKRLRASANFNPGYHDSADRYGHGTFVAGIVAGSGSHSGQKYIGVAPRAELANVRVSDDQGMSTESAVISALQWVLDNKARYNIRVVNLSLNSAVAQSYQTSPLCAAVEILWFNGIVVVAAAGNNGTTTLYPPANDPFVITVGATDDKGTLSTADDGVTNFSAYGVTESGFAKPELVAPGRRIIGLLPDNEKLNMSATRIANRVDKNYFKMSGTSVSAPMVSGAVAILLQDEPNLTPDQVKYRLMATANKIWPGYNPVTAGAGYLDIYAAVNGTTTESANAGLPASQLLWSGTEPVVWGSVNWNSVNWNSVNWNSVNWNSVNWNSVNWNSDYWEP